MQKNQTLTKTMSHSKLDNDLSIRLYQSISEDNVERVFKHWHASSIAMCPRAHYFKRLGKPENTKPTAAKILRWGAGHHLETSIRPHIAKLYPLVGTNMRLTSKELDLTGEFDNFSFPAKTIIEIKSVDDYAFIEKDGNLTLKEADGKWPNGTNKWGPKLEPYTSHQLQNHAYVLLLKEQGIEVEKIDYIYLALKGRVVAYSTKVQEELLDNVKERLKVLNEAWATKKAPVCICDEKHPLWGEVLQWCPYRTEDGCCKEEK